VIPSEDGNTLSPESAFRKIQDLFGDGVFDEPVLSLRDLAAFLRALANALAPEKSSDDPSVV
jgi:hypothetical protein